MIDSILSYPPTYVVSLLVCLVIAADVAIRPGIAWRVPCLVTIGTVFAWYLIEPVYTFGQFALLDRDDISATFLGVILFLVALRIFVPLFAGRYDGMAASQNMRLSPEVARRLLFGAAGLWLFLAVFGVSRMEWDVVAALYPNGRTEAGSMWARGAVASGSGDSFVAAAGYLYLLVLAVFGILANFVRGGSLRLLCVVLIALSWPYAFLIGSRNITLAVVTPGFLAFLLYGRSRFPVKAIVTIVLYVVLDQAFRIIIAYRNVGFDHIGDINVEEVQHAGLNMASEMTNIIGFLRIGILRLQWGYGYLIDLSQVIPRFIWPNKPLLNIDYAIARGFASATSESGVNTTISQGMIGGSVRQFGAIGGPVAAAAIMAGWIRILTALSTDRRVSRACLYLLGLGLTFNLGRDITLLVLWPFVFAYVGVLAYEAAVHRKLTGR